MLWWGIGAFAAYFTIGGIIAEIIVPEEDKQNGDVMVAVLLWPVPVVVGIIYGVLLTPYWVIHYLSKKLS